MEGPNFLDLGMYAAGGGLPEGDYVWTDLTIQMFAGFSQTSKGPSRLGCMITMKSLNDQSAEERQQFYSFGSSADKSFAPNPETGKSIVAVPGGPGSTLNNSTNWALLLKSLYDSGLPVGIGTNDVSVFEGLHVHMMNIPEPAERAGFQSKTGEAAEERKPGTVAIVSEIKDDGKPWEGTGGLAAKPAAKAKAAKTVAKPAPEPEAESADEDVEAAAMSAISTVIGKTPTGMPKLLLRTGTFTAVKNSSGPDMAQAVTDTYFATDDALNTLVGQVGYQLKNGQILPIT